MHPFHENKAYETSFFMKKLLFFRLPLSIEIALTLCYNRYLVSKERQMTIHD